MPGARTPQCYGQRRTLCFFGFLRSGEITVPSDNAIDEGAHLCFKDIQVDSMEEPKVLQVTIKADQFRLGVDIFVGRTNGPLRPVSAVLAYMVRRGLNPGPFFQFSNGIPFTWTKFVTAVKEALTDAGVDCTPFSGHSFRSGAATTAAEGGLDDSMIKMLGRWKSSAYLQLYIKTSRHHLAQVSRILAGN